MLVLFYILFLAGGAILFWGDPNWFPSFYRPKIMAAASFMFALAIYMPRLIFRPASTLEKERALQNLQKATAACLLLTSLGTLGLYQLYRIGFEYDKLVHFLFTLIATLAIAGFASGWYGIKKSQALTIAVLLVLVGIGLWETIEFYADLILGIKIFEVYSRGFGRDTILDMSFGVLGIIAGATILYKSAGRKPWGNRRQ